MASALSMTSDTAARRTPGFMQGIMLLLPITMSVMGISVLSPVMHLMLEHFQYVPNHEYLVIGGVLTMPSIWVLLFSPVAGWLADRLGRRKLLLWSMVVYAFVGIAPTMLDNLYAIIVSRAALGVCESIVMTVSTTMISDYFSGAARERWLASQTAVASISAMLIIFLGGELGAALGWRGPFYLYLYSLILVIPVAAYTWEPDEKARAEAATRQGSTAGEPSEFPWARILGCCAITLLASVCFYTIITKNAEAYVALGLRDPARIGTLTMLASVGVPIGTFLYWALARLPIGWLLFVDFGLVGIGFVWMGMAHNPIFYTWGSLINQFGCGLVLPTMLVWTTRGLPYRIRGRCNGMWQATFAIGQFLSGMIVTAISGPLGGLLPALVFIGKSALGVAVLAAISGLIFRAPRPAGAPA